MWSWQYIYNIVQYITFSTTFISYIFHIFGCILRFGYFSFILYVYTFWNNSGLIQHRLILLKKWVWLFCVRMAFNGLCWEIVTSNTIQTQLQLWYCRCFNSCHVTLWHTYLVQEACRSIDKFHCYKISFGTNFTFIMRCGHDSNVFHLVYIFG